MKKALILILSIIATQGYSQLTSTWKGNAPGHESQWEWPANWSNNSLPDEFTDVIILLDETYSHNYPVIRSGRVQINSLYMSPGTSLILKKGELFIIDSLKSHYKKEQVIGTFKNAQPTFMIDEMTTVKIN